MTAQRPPRADESCLCGKPAVLVYLLDNGRREVPWCGVAVVTLYRDGLVESEGSPRC